MKETIKEEINIRKIEGQLKAALIELEDLRNRAHRGSSEDSNDNQTDHQGHRAIYAQFVNWRTAEEIRNRVIELNSKKQTPVIVNQMFSKELTKR